MDVEDGVNEAIGAQKGELAITSATVLGDSLGTEKTVIAEQQWRAIHERRAAGMKVSKIARELDLDRKTVRSALKRRAWQPYRRRASSGTRRCGSASTQ